MKLQKSRFAGFDVINGMCIIAAIAVLSFATNVPLQRITGEPVTDVSLHDESSRDATHVAVVQGWSPVVRGKLSVTR